MDTFVLGWSKVELTLNNRVLIKGNELAFQGKSKPRAPCGWWAERLGHVRLGNDDNHSLDFTVIIREVLGMMRGSVELEG